MKYSEPECQCDIRAEGEDEFQVPDLGQGVPGDANF